MKLKNKHEREFLNALKNGYRVASRIEEVCRIAFPKLSVERAYEIAKAFEEQN